jgi:large subunit ribosomal protein L21
MHAIVEACGRQYELKPGRFVDVELVSAEPNDKYVFDRVVMVVDGDKSQVGQPLIAGAKVTGRVLAHGRKSKILVYKMRPKKGTRKKQGHRQGYTRIFIESISLGDKVVTEAKDERAGQAKAAPAEKPAKKAVEKTAEKAEAKEAKKPAEAKKAESKKAPAKATGKVEKSEAKAEKSEAKPKKSTKTSKE